MLSKFSLLRRISRIYLMIGSQRCPQKSVASKQPSKSPRSQAQQSPKLPHFPRTASCMESAMVMAGLMTSAARGAKDRAMWQKMAMLMYPESSFSMKVVLGLDRIRVNSTKMKMPIVSFEITFKMSSPPFSSKGSSSLCPRTSHQKRAASAAENWARKQKGRTLALYLLYFLRKFASVTVGFTLAPQSSPEKKMAMSSAPVAWASLSQMDSEQLYPQVKMKTARNSNPKSCFVGAMFMMLNSSWSNLLSVLSFRVFEFLSYYSSWAQMRGLLISSIQGIGRWEIIDQIVKIKKRNIWEGKRGSFIRIIWIKVVNRFIIKKRHNSITKYTLFQLLIQSNHHNQADCSFLKIQDNQQNLHINMAEDANNVINNYKGVMLCSRPNEKKAVDYNKPFCGRVVPGQLLGLNPVKIQHALEEQLANKGITALDKHKKWLNEFKDNIQKTKEDIDEKARKEEDKFRKIREQAEADRERARKMKEEYNLAATQVLNVLEEKSVPAQPSGELTADNLRRLDAQNERKQRGDFKKKDKGEKPVWAMTKQQVEENEEKEVDELLDFFETNNVNDFSEDEEVKDLLSSLKQKIEKMKEADDWKEKEVERMKKDREQRRNNNQVEGEEDKYSQFSAGNSEGRSVASDRTQKKIEQLRNKKAQQQQWDKFTTSQKSAVNVDDRIAKNIADEVLRNYPNLKGVHSNVSIRRLLEAEAAKVISEPIVRPVITTIVKEKQPINANTLPYLHRNPAI